jgi:PAS domain S-box-containing protein
MFGYQHGQLEGKNVSLLMPQPFSGRHNGYLRNYQTTGKAKILDTLREVRMGRCSYVSTASRT